MALRDELTEPWGLLLGATAAGTAWAVGLPAAAAAGVGAVVWATKAATAALERRRPPRLTGRRLPVDARAPEESGSSGRTGPRRASPSWPAP